MESKTAQEINNRLDELESKRARLAAKLAEIVDDIEALSRARDILTSKKQAPRSGSKTGAIRSVVLEAIKSTSGEFEVGDIISWLEDNKPDTNFKRSAVYSTIKRLAAGGEIKQIVDASGRRAARYRLPATDDQPSPGVFRIHSA